MTISRMQQPRQQYGLGSFVKKIGKKIKKVAKSPLGKAAIAIGIGSLIPGAGIMGKFNTAKNFLGGTVGGMKAGPFDYLSKSKGTKGLLGKLGLIKGKGDFGLTGLGKIAAIGIPSLIAGMGASKEGEGGFSDSGDRREGLENYLRFYFKNLNPNAKQSEIDEFVRVNMYADGGRVDYAVGSGPMARAIAAPATPPKDLTGPISGRPIPEQSEGDKLYQDVLDYLKSDSNQIEAKKPEATPMPFNPEEMLYGSDPLKNVLETERDSSIQILKERGFDPDKMKFMKGDYGLLEAVKASGEVESAKELFEKGFLDKQYSFQDLYGNMDLMDKVKNLYMDKIFMPNYSGPSINNPGITNLPENKEKEEKAIGGINYESKLKQRLADGGRIGYAMGSKAEQNAIQAAGIEGLMLNQNPAGVTELDLRETGGFIPPVGAKEKADDIPAMLANNEFVFTADAVRGMGDGDVNKGAQRMYDMMKTLEEGGRV